MNNENHRLSILQKEFFSFEQKASDSHQLNRGTTYYNLKDRRRVYDSYQDSINLQCDDDTFTYQEKQKLRQIMNNIQHMKHKRKAHELVMNLPSRMIKSFNQNKFSLLDDRSYIFDERFFQQSIVSYNEKANQTEKGQLSPTSIDVRSKQKQANVIDGNDNQSVKKQKNLFQSVKSKISLSFLSFQKAIKKCVNKGMTYFDSIPIVSPSNGYKMIWDILNMIILLICMFYLPIAITFQITMASLFSEQLTFIIPLFLVLDILISMNTGYFDKGQVVNSRIKIIHNFFREKTIRDVISIIPFLILVYKQIVIASKYSPLIQVNSKTNQFILDLFQMIFYFKVFSLSSTLWKIEERFNLSRKYLNYLQLAKLLFTILIINHLFACLWVYTAKLEIEAGYEITWMSYDKIFLKEWGGQYLSAFYFTTVTMITVGYGDILPKNEIEMVLCIATMTLACGVFGYSINQIGTIFSNIFYVDNQIKNQISQIQRFMSKKNINTKLQYQIREYLEYYLREQAEMNQEQEQLIIEQLSESLRSKLLFEANKIVLKDSPIFKHNFSKAVIEQTVPLIKEIKFSPESFIFLKGVQDDGAIYFIENGSVEIVLDQKNKCNKTLFQLNKGDSFGAHSFFTGFPRMNFIRSKEFTTVLKIGRQEFLNLIQRFPEDYETFCSIRDSINYLGDYSRIGLNCISCGSSYHMVNECQYIHFIPKKARIIRSFNDQFNLGNPNRITHSRRNVNKGIYFKNSLFIQKQVSKQAKSQIILFHKYPFKRS